MATMRTLIYKRTHKGDPDENGWFGAHDCMGRVRKTDFDAVIGTGGMSSGPRSAGIAGKVNWIGIGAKKRRNNGRAPMVSFEHFVLFYEDGQDLWKLAPKLAARMYKDHAPRIKFNQDLTATEKAEVSRLLQLAVRKPASAARPGEVWSRTKQRCRICC